MKVKARDGTTYAFTILAARLLGPAEYGALAAVMGVLLVVNVLSLGLQATGARRVSASPHHRPQIEHEVLATSYASALVLGLVMLAAIPVLAAARQSPKIHASDEPSSFLRYIWLVPTATAAVLVFGAVETGGFALFPVYGHRIGYSESDAALLLSMIGLGNVILQIPLGFLSDRIGDRRILLIACAVVGLLGMLVMPWFATNWTLMAAMLFVWGGSVAALYTVGLAHLGSRLTGRELASANAAFVFCYGFGTLIGPQVIGIGMDAFGPDGFGYSQAQFIALTVARMAWTRR